MKLRAQTPVKLVELRIPATPLAETLVNIRKRLGENQRKFAQRLMVQQTTLSRYESGKIVPGTFVLMRLHELATPAERRILSAELGREWQAARSAVEKGYLRVLEEAVSPQRVALMEKSLRETVQDLLSPQSLALMEKALQETVQDLLSPQSLALMEKALRELVQDLPDPHSLALMEKAVRETLQDALRPRRVAADKRDVAYRSVAERSEKPPMKSARLEDEATRKGLDPATEICWMCEKYKDDKRAAEFFRDAAAYLRLRLSNLK